MKKKVIEEYLPTQLEKLEKMATPTGFIAGKSVWVESSKATLLDVKKCVDETFNF